MTEHWCLPSLTHYSLFIGRWQPFHDGHKRLIDSVLAEGKCVLIACRMTRMDNRNPLSYARRAKIIREIYPDKERVKIISIPDIAEVCWGRDVGWKPREIRLDADTEAISGTEIRGRS